ncbi:HAMP domain-containing protein [Gemmatimonadota bacterium]
MRSPKLQTLVLAVLIPTLLGASTWMGWLTYQELYTIILEGFDQKLRATSAGTAAFIEIDDHDALVREGTETDFRYVRYVSPMQRIVDLTELTYLYTTLLEPDGSITYVLDGTVGEDHSEIGSSDVLSDEEILRLDEMRQMLRDGSVFLSGLNPTEQWGILKTAFAPIAGANPALPAMAGADVNISVVGTKARVAIAQVGLTALLSLLLGAAVSFWLARRLGAPLIEVKDGAMRVAAGEFGHRISAPQYEEMEELAATFNYMSDAIGDTLSDLSEQQKVSEADRRTVGLVSELAARRKSGAMLPPGIEIEAPPPSDPSGYAFLPSGGSIFWIGPQTEPLDALGLRAEVEAFIGLLGENCEWEEMVRLISPLLGTEIRVLLNVDAAGTRIRAHAVDSIPALITNGEEGGTLVDLAAHPDLTLKPAQTLRIASTDLGRGADSAGLDVQSWESGEVSDGLMVVVRSPEVPG